MQSMEEEQGWLIPMTNASKVPLKYLKHTSEVPLAMLSQPGGQQIPQATIYQSIKI